jgi:tRNA/tmRNA/rRNA uracil-C5-methylase (TrmA/RlmC/RlmD family)
VLADLYAGAGLLVALALTERPPRSVFCVEPEGRNARWIRTNLQGQGLDIRRLRVEETTVERAIRRGVGRTLAGQAGTILLDPPRRGLSREVRRWLTTSPRRAARLVYLSCDAAALARDLGALKEHYRLVKLTVFDFYPQTAHIETLAILDPV